MKIVSRYARKLDDGIFGAVLKSVRRFQMTARTIRYVCSFLYFFVLCASLAVAQGTYTQIDFPEALMTQANGINGAGLIVGGHEDNAADTDFCSRAAPIPKSIIQVPSPRLLRASTIGVRSLEWLNRSDTFLT
jgi:hypothetical protein